MSAKEHKIKILWFSRNPSLFNDKKEKITNLGYEVFFVSKTQNLRASINLNRAKIVIISDDFEDQTMSVVEQVCSAPELSSSRFILSVSTYDAGLYWHSSFYNIKDIIPCDLKIDQWIERFLFATLKADASISLSKLKYQIESKGELSVPCQIISVNKNIVRIEAPLIPPPGSILKFKSHVDTKLEPIIIQVTGVEHSGLFYRYGCAIKGLWKAPRFFVDSLNLAPKLKIFLIVKDPILRSYISVILEELRCKVNIALSFDHIFPEIKFFTPHVVIIEESLRAGVAAPIDKALKEKIFRGFLIVLAQKDKPLKNLWPGTEVLQNINKENIVALLEKARVTVPTHKHIVQNENLGKGILSFSAKINAISVDHIDIISPFKLTKYHLFTLKIPIFNHIIDQDIWLKTIHVEKEAHSSSFSIRGLTTNLFQKERMSLVQTAINSALEETASENRSTNPLTKILPQNILKNFLEIKTLHYILIFIFFAFLTAFLIKSLMPTILEHYQKSGGLYSDQLKKFSSSQTEPSE